MKPLTAMQTTACPTTDTPRAPQKSKSPAVPSREWEVAGVIEWMMMHGRIQYPKPKEFINALCEHLAEAAAPLWRVRLGARTLHPQFAAWSVLWKRGAGAEENLIQHGVELTDNFVNSPVQHVTDTRRAFRRNLHTLSDDDHAVLHEVAAEGGTDYLALPVVFSDSISTLIIASDKKDGLDDNDIAQFEKLALYLGPVLEVMSVRLIARVLLDTYVGPRTGRKILDGAVRRGDSEKISAALWFSDLRNFTKMSETLSSDAMLSTLNEYFEGIGTAVTQYGGEILRFIGDAMLIIFPVYDDRDQTGACRDALSAALDAVVKLEEANGRRRHEGQPAIRFGVGLNLGEVVYGNVGTVERLEYTVMGSAVNLAARLEGLTKTIGRSIIFSRTFARRLNCPVVSHGMHTLKGVAEPREALSLGDDEALSGLVPRDLFRNE